MPAKNEEQYIGKCLQGIARLDFDKSLLEVILVDNGSSDRTVEIATSFGAKIVSVPHQATIAALRNQGAEVARGNLLAFVDADCIPREDWLNNALRHFRDPSVACVGSKPGIPEHGATWVERTWSVMKAKPVLAASKWLSSCNFIVRNKVFVEVGGFDSSLVTCEDADIGYRISSKWNMTNDPAVRVVHLREPKTIGEFFKKEVWHGVGNYVGLKRHGLISDEIPSLVIPLWTSLSLLGLVGALLVREWQFMCGAVISFLVPPLAITLTKMRTVRGVVLGMFFLYIIYCVARTVAIFNAMFRGK